jgi:integrase
MTRASHTTLTDKFIRGLPPAPPGARRSYHDTIVPEMALRVTDSGHKSFTLTARFPRHPKNSTRRALGDWRPADAGEAKLESAPGGSVPVVRAAALTVDGARRMARAWLELLSGGIDPQDEADRLLATATREGVAAKQQAAILAATPPTFATVATAFLDRHVRGPSHCELMRRAGLLRERHPNLTARAALDAARADPRNAELMARARREGIKKKTEAERIIQAEFVARWGDRPADDIKPAEIAAAIRAIADRGAPYQAHNALGYVRRLYSWASGTHQFGLETSPVDRLRPGDLIGRRWARDRVLTDDELCVLWEALGGAAGAEALAEARRRDRPQDRWAPLAYPYGPLIRLLVLTGQRVHEVADARWPEFDLDAALWTIPAERMKGGRPHAVPLAPAALALTDALPRFVAGDHLFSTTDGMKPVNGFSKTKERIDARMGRARPEVAPWVLHDIRRTVRTHFSAIGGVSDVVRELAIAHAQRGIHAVYDRHAYIQERRHLFEEWERRLADILAPVPPDVANLEAERALRRVALSAGRHK